MLEEVLPVLSAPDRKHLIGRLDRAAEGTAIQAAWELAVLWAMHRQLEADLKVKARDGGRPDCRLAIGLSKPLMIEVYSPTGQTFAFKGKLDQATRELQGIVESAAPGTGGHLRITYHEWAQETGHGRRLRVPSIAANAPSHLSVITAVEAFWRGGATRQRIEIDGLIHATFERTPYRLPGLNYSCQIPAKPQSIAGTFTQTIIDKAKRQLKPFRSDHLTGLVICDGGNDVVSNPHDFRPSMNPTGSDIMGHVLRESGIDFITCVGRIDRVVWEGMVLSPHNRRPELAVETFLSAGLDQRESESIRQAIEPALRLIPVPIIHPYQSKSLQDQEAAGASPRRTRKIFQVSSDRVKMEIRVSARAVLELLSGKLSTEEFRRSYMMRGPCDFAEWAIVKIALAKDEDADDDHVVLTLSKDPAARSFAEMAVEITRPGQGCGQ